MSWARSDAPAQAWLGAGHAAWRSPGSDVTVRPVQSVAEGLELLAAWAASLPGAGPLRVWLGGDLCRLACVPAIGGARSLQDAQAAVQICMRAEGQLAEDETVTLAEAPGSAARWRVAVLPAGLTDRLVTAVGGRASSVRPWWSWALRHRDSERIDGSSPPASVLCAYDGAALVICAWDESGAVAAADTAVPIENLSAARRLLLRRGLAGGHQAKLACVRIAWPGEEMAPPADALPGVPSRTAAATRAEGDDFLLAPWVRSSDAF